MLVPDTKPNARIETATARGGRRFASGVARGMVAPVAIAVPYDERAIYASKRYVLRLALDRSSIDEPRMRQSVIATDSPCPSHCDGHAAHRTESRIGGFGRLRNSYEAIE